MKQIAVFGASGAIGGALAYELAQRFPEAMVHAISRQACSFREQRIQTLQLADYSEASLQGAAQLIAGQGTLHMVVVANGILHGDALMPEKSLRDLSADKFQQVFEANTIVPALVAKYFLPVMDKGAASVFAALSARVGSISDNRLGGWYAYRASKAALNMIIKNAAIETARRNPKAVVVGIHPGTVDSGLSKPFQSNVADNKLFTPDYAAGKIADVLLCLNASQSGKCFAWDGQEVLP